MIDAKIKVRCTDNGKDLDAHVLNYKPQGFLEVAIQTLKLRLAYRAQTKAFVGSLGGKEFVVKEADLPQERREFQR
jgi:hypothetical protein